MLSYQSRTHIVWQDKLLFVLFTFDCRSDNPSDHHGVHTGTWTFINYKHRSAIEVVVPTLSTSTCIRSVVLHWLCLSLCRRFRVTLHVPATWTDVPQGTPLLFAWDTGSEAMIWTHDGQPVQVSRSTSSICVKEWLEALNLQYLCIDRCIHTKSTRRMIGNNLHIPHLGACGAYLSVHLCLYLHGTLTQCVLWEWTSSGTALAYPFMVPTIHMACVFSICC